MIRKQILWVTLLFLQFSIILGTFCYFLGKTGTWGGAFSEFYHFGIGLLPIFIGCFVVAIMDLRREAKKQREE